MPLLILQIESLSRANPQLHESLRLARASLGPNQGWSLDAQITDDTDFARVSSSALTTNKIDPVKSGVLMHGSFTHVSTTRITWSWSGLQILRAEGTTTFVTIGSLNFSGLATGTPFYSIGMKPPGLSAG